jgi:phospholipase/lecithinase/hemolysin
VPGMPDLGNVPFLLSMGPGASYFFTQVSIGFNQALQANLPPGAQYFDTFSVLSSVISNPGMYGITNITDPCWTGASLCANPENYAFFDKVHPTTAVHEIMGNALYESVVPEPSTLSFLSLGLVGLIGYGWKRYKK